MTKTRGQLLAVTKELSDVIVVPRESEFKDGYQRDVREEKVRKIVAYAEAGKPLFPIILVKSNNGGYKCLDGQHRLEAFRRRAYPLDAYLIDLGKFAKDEGGVFCEINTTQTRVGLKHRLKVDTSPEFTKIRALASEYNASPHQVHSICAGVSARWTISMTKAKWEVVEEMLKQWTTDPRWENMGAGRTTTKAEGGFFAASGTLMAVAAVAFPDRNPKKAISILKGMNYYRSGHFSEIYGSGSETQQRMRARMAKFLLNGK